MEGSTAPWLLWALCSSLALHGVGYASLGSAPRSATPPRPPSEVRFQVLPSPPPVPEPVAAPVEVPRPPLAAPRRAVETARAEPPPASAAETPEPAAPLDLSGVTLTNRGGPSGFSMPAGTGDERTAPLSGRAAPAPAPLASVAPRAVATLVPYSDLSARPAPPSLEAALREHYPLEARRRAIAGNARVRARVDADGVVRSVQVVAESFPGFGAACRRTLRGSRWSPPRDGAGRAVATEVRYTCRFVVVP